MSYEERNTWFYGTTAVLGYGLYLLLLLPRVSEGSLTDTPYQHAMLISIGAGIAVGIIGGIVLGAFQRTGEPRGDVRDRDISRLGERIGKWFFIAAAMSAFALALLDAASFWIANALYLGFVLFALVSSIVRIAAYRGAWEA